MSLCPLLRLSVLWWPHSRFTKCLTPHYLIDCDIIEVKDWRKVNLIDFVEGFLAFSEMTYTRESDAALPPFF